MNRMKKVIFLLMAVLLLFSPTAAFAQVPYTTLTLTSDYDIVQTQTAYQPVGVVDGYEIIEIDPDTGEAVQIPLSSPEDIFIDNQDRVYVADSDNSRIVVFDSSGRYIRSFGQDVLKKPTGVFVTDDGLIYVADERKGAVVCFDQEGNVVKEYGKPDSALYGKDNLFKPVKVIVDKRGNLYIVGQGIVHGLIQMSQEGEFLGFFGGNQTGFDLKRYLQKKFYTDAQLDRMIKKLPPSATNVAIDDEGLVYTSTVGVKSEEIKRLNVAGKNLLPSKSYSINYKTSIADITVDKMGNIFAVDSESGWVYEYDRDGNLLFMFGGTDTGNQRMGLFKSPSGIAVSSEGNLYVLDKQRNNFQILKPTEFTGLVHEAIGYYLDGKYVQSEEPWTDVLRLNSIFDLAHTGIGMAAFKKEDYATALEQFEVANNKTYYSDAYWEIRRTWLMSNASKFMIGFVIAIVAWYIFKALHRKYGIANAIVKRWSSFRSRTLVAQLLQVFRMLRHPIDGYWEIEAEKKGSVLSATILLLVMVGVHLFKVFETNFLFSNVDLKQVNLLSEVCIIVIPLLAWVVSNYLVSTINDGEGKFKDVYKGTIYAMSPYIIFTVPVTILSKGLTEMEIVVYDFANMAIVIWCALLIFIKVKEVHGYEIGESFKNIGLTIFGIAVMGMIAFILFGLSNQVTDFIVSIYQEVKLRVHL
ncbi:YIP1 family protein [Paenibacillus marinisediminis]